MTSPGQCIAVASGKGGTGKTSFTAGVGAALALSGRRVLCLDCDIGLRNLDLALGLSDRTLMDFSDVAQNRCSLELAAVEHPKIPGLFLLTAPARPHGRPVTEIQMADLLREVRRRFDFCLLDAPAGLGGAFSWHPAPRTLRGGDHCGRLLPAGRPSTPSWSWMTSRRRPAPGGESGAQKAAAPAPRHH